MAGAATILADAAERVHATGQLADALDELAVRCDRIGAGPLLDSWARKRVKRQRQRRRWLARNRP